MKFLNFNLANRHGFFSIFLMFLILSGCGVYILIFSDANRKIYEFSISESELQVLGEEIRYYDEVLTMSAKMAAATGNLAWKVRYSEFEPKLDRIIKVAINLSSEEHHHEIKKIEETNVILVEMENAVFKFIETGDRDSAEKILSNKEYSQQKTLYSMTVNSLLDSIRRQINLNKSMLLKRKVNLKISIAVFFILMAILWLIIFRSRSEYLTKINENNEEKSLIFDNALDAVINIDTSGKIIDWNHQATTIFGWTADEAVGQPLASLIIPERYRARHTQGVHRYLETGEGTILNKRIEITGLKRSGKEFPVELAITALRTGEKLFFNAFIRDITARIETHEAIRNHEKKALKSRDELKILVEKLKKAKEASDSANQAKSVFLANMSHELRTPLNSILGFSQIMARDSSVPIKHKNHIERIIRSGNYLLTLINDVLEISKIEAGRSQLLHNRLDLFNVLDDVEDVFFHMAHEKGIRFSIQRTGNVPRYIVSDERKLRQVLLNLLSNAIKFTDHGKVILRIQLNPGDDSSLTVGSPISLHFEVEDTGFGIASNELNKLFEKFGQTQSGIGQQQGIGLGLPISQHFVRMLGGIIEVESEVNKGSKFMFDIKAELAETPLDESSFSLTNSVIGLEAGQDDFRILIVDDNMENQGVLLELMETIGVSTKTACDGHKAVQIAKDWQPHLIWMDLQMPVLGGPEAALKIRAQPNGASIVIIAVTACVFEDSREEVIKSGFNDLIRKPFQEKIIFEKMAEHLGFRFLYGKRLSRVESSSQWPAERYRKVLSGISEGWKHDVIEAALGGEADKLREHIAKISDIQPAFSQLLSRIVDAYQFDKIVDMINNETLKTS